MALEQSEEYGVDGLLKAKYGDCFIRGNNGQFCRIVQLFCFNREYADLAAMW